MIDYWPEPYPCAKKDCQNNAKTSTESDYCEYHYQEALNKRWERANREGTLDDPYWEW